MTPEKRANLHKHLDRLLDAIEARGFTAALMPMEVSNVAAVPKKGRGAADQDDDAIKIKAQLLIDNESFKPEFRKGVGHLFPFPRQFALVVLPESALLGEAGEAPKGTEEECAQHE